MDSVKINNRDGFFYSTFINRLNESLNDGTFLQAHKKYILKIHLPFRMDYP